MRTQLQESCSAGRNDLHAILVPKGSKPSLPDSAPSPTTWKADFSDKNGSSLMLRGEAGKRWLLIRVPGKRDITDEDVRGAAGTARLAAEELERPTVCVDLSGIANDASFAQAAAEGAGMAGYDMGILKKGRATAHVKKIMICGAGKAKATRDAVKAGHFGALANLYARELANLPANILNPKDFAKRARAVCRAGTKMSCKVMGRRQAEEMKMGAMLGVSQGSANELQLVHMVYKPKGKPKGKIALVGKGLTFDTGGISLKPSGKMEDMKFDMCGAAAVLGAFHALSKGADCPYEVHGILGCVENMPGSNAQRPGDIVTAMNGMTIEVHNTDAEGRLVLADCLTYTARKVKPDRIYDMATLTGAAIISLGHLRTAVLGNDQKLVDDLMAKGDSVGEKCWQLPLDEDYRDLTRGSYADLQNIYNPGQGAGTIAGASFLSFFVEEVPWVHLDIAATAWEGPARSYFANKGGRGAAARTMVALLRG